MRTRRPGAVSKTMHGSIAVSKGDSLFHLCNQCFLLFSFVIMVYPLIYIISCSFSSPAAVVSGRVFLWPVDLSLKGYTAVFENPQVVIGYYNSFVYTLVGTAINILFTILAAYPLSRKGVVMGSKVIMFLFVFTMLFTGGMIPSYILVTKLGLYNTRWAMWLPGALSVWNLMITKTFFQHNIPGELFEAAYLEGAGEFTILRRIVLPLSGTIIAVNALFYAVGHWNSYFSALIYLKDSKLFPLQIILRNILIINQVDASMLDIEDLMEREALKDLLKYSLIVVASVPVLVVYPFVQRFFVKGVMIGSLKG